MMSNVITVKVLDRDYTVGCPADQAESLQSAAKLLDKQMRDIQGASKTVSLERVAVLAGLNLAHDLHLLNATRKQSDAIIDRNLVEMNRKLDDLFDNLPR
ncbi:MAG: cell division protein ZapA [Arenimonas sp.]|nr:cell division protein ZapA [Arenimonas sp.]MBP6309676.1 cell division protein ZapA [Arenimonas sp.]